MLVPVRLDSLHPVSLACYDETTQEGKELAMFSIGSLFAMITILLMYLLVFLFIIGIAYLVIRKAVLHGILDARAKIKELEEAAPHPKTPEQPHTPQL